MTEYWVSQGNKWCEFCKIFISANPISVRNHELGLRHRNKVSDRLAAMHRDNAAKEKEQNSAALALLNIEAKANKSYQKDLAGARVVNASRAVDLKEWEFESSSGYYYHRNNGLRYDPNSGFYSSDDLGKWVSKDEAYASLSSSSKGPPSSSASSSLSGKKAAPTNEVVIIGSEQKGYRGPAKSSVVVTKRKRPEKTKVVSEEEEAALKAREAAKRRVEEREKNLRGLYKR